MPYAVYPLNFDIIFCRHIFRRCNAVTPRGGAQITRMGARLYTPGVPAACPFGTSRGIVTNCDTVIPIHLQQSVDVSLIRGNVIYIAKQDGFATCLSTLCTRYESVSINLQLRSDDINWNDAQLQRLLLPQDCNDISTIQGSPISGSKNLK